MSSESLHEESSIPLQERDLRTGESQAQQRVGDIAIRVQNLSKCYQLYDRPEDRLKQAIYPRLRRLMGMEPKSYAREFWALRDVSFEVKKGETVGIIGRNGSGKSTLLQLICGTLAPTCGTVETNGRVAALLELGAGFNSEFTGQENVYMNGALLGLSRQEIDARFDDIAAFADIGQFIDQPVKTYSSGMYVRLAFAVIAHVDADILVVDEALAVGDAFFVQKCMRFLRKFMEAGTVLFVSHDTGAVLNLCKRAAWLHGGNLELMGLPKEVTAAYLKALYESQQGESAVPRDGIRITSRRRPQQPRDMRLDFINTTPYRNDIQLFEFVPHAAAFGKGGARIMSVQLIDENGAPLTWVVGGENVSLIIKCVINVDLHSPIVGFYVKDRLGQTLFGDNTFLTYRDASVPVREGQNLEARFDFCMPVLPVGDYSMQVAIADGTQDTHVQHHWIHDALLLKSHSSSVRTGLVGVPMTDIKLRVM